MKEPTDMTDDEINKHSETIYTFINDFGFEYLTERGRQFFRDLKAEWNKRRANKIRQEQMEENQS